MLDGSIIKVHQDAMRSSYDKAGRIATRYDKTARMYLTGVMFVGILLALK